jgi:hypothetical protein
MIKKSFKAPKVLVRMLSLPHETAARIFGSNEKGSCPCRKLTILASLRDLFVHAVLEGRGAGRETFTSVVSNCPENSLTSSV